MPTMNEKRIKSTDIRKKAEEALKGKTTDLIKLSSGDAQSLVHELEVHQIELEMQNEELRGAQKELEDARNRYSDLYDFAPISYFTFDKNGLILQVNLTGAKKLGIERGNLIKKPFSLYIAPGHKDTFYLHLLEVFKTEKQMSCELMLVDNKGNIFDAKLESLPVHDSDGNLLCRTAMSDISQRKVAEEDLKKHREHLEEMVKERTKELNISREKEHAAALYSRKLIETSLDPLVTIYKDGIILDVNKATELATGFSRDKIIGSDFSGYFTEPEKAKEGYNLVFIQGFVRDYPLAIRHVSGKITYVLYNASVYRNETGEIEGVFAAARDVTERRLAEESMRFAKEEAERANMAKTNFLQIMSHELRTPLNAILGFSEMLKQKTSGELNEKQEHYINNIITGGNNLHNIISQILDAVKIYDGTLELRIEKIPVPETLDEIIGVIKEKAAKKNVLLEKNIDLELEYIEADKEKFKQLFINLLDNAVKFSKDEGGTVTINAKKEGDMAKFSVSDRGIGIKEEDMEKIFRKFTQLDSGTSRKYGGTGIGLAITKQFVELHGGNIFAKSKYGERSTFIFTIPLKDMRRRSNK